MNENVEMNQEQLAKTDETAVAKAPDTNMNWLDTKTMAAAWKTASMLSNSGLLPQTYQKHPENVLIALDLASRMDMSLMTVCQNLYIVQGKPAWSGQFCIAAINASGNRTQEPARSCQGQGSQGT
jgi:hypothetical protein